MENKKNVWLWAIGGLAIVITVVIGMTSGSGLFKGCIGRSCTDERPSEESGRGGGGGGEEGEPVTPPVTPPTIGNSTDLVVESMDIEQRPAGYNNSYKVDYMRFTVYFKNKAPDGTKMDWHVLVTNKDGEFIDNTPYLAQKTLATSTYSYAFEVVKKRICSDKVIEGGVDGFAGGVKIVLDPQDKVDEYNEGNNYYISAFACGPDGVQIDAPWGNQTVGTDVNRAKFAQMAAVVMANSKGEKIPDVKGDCGFKDLTPGEWYTPYICYLVDKGIMNGYQDGTFKPWNLMNRAEAVKMLMVIYLDIKPAGFLLVAPAYNDTAGTWFSDHIQSAAITGISEIKPWSDASYYPWMTLDNLTLEKLNENLYKALK